MNVPALTSFTISPTSFARAAFAAARCVLTPLPLRCLMLRRTQSFEYSPLELSQTPMSVRVSHSAHLKSMQAVQLHVNRLHMITSTSLPVPLNERYCVLPGQATSYKVGQLELLRQRALLKERKGAAFDPRAFHDAVLSAGAVPLDLLPQVIAGI